MHLSKLVNARILTVVKQGRLKYYRIAAAAVAHAVERLFAAQCLDFTERRHHLAGALGAALLERMVEMGWIVKSRVPRAVRLSAKGKMELSKRLRLKFTDNQNVKYESH